MCNNLFGLKNSVIRSERQFSPFLPANVLLHINIIVLLKMLVIRILLMYLFKACKNLNIRASMPVPDSAWSYSWQ